VTLVTLVQGLLGDFDFDSLFESERDVGPLLSLVYSCLFAFILLTMLIAIINEAFVDVLAEEVEQDVAKSKTQSTWSDRDWLQGTSLAQSQRQNGRPGGVGSGAIRMILHRAEDLANGDYISSDPYVKIFVTDDGLGKQSGGSSSTGSAGGKAHRKPRGIEGEQHYEQRTCWDVGRNAYKSTVLTRGGGTVTSGLSTWDERVEFDVAPGDSTVVFSVYDYDMMTSDEFLGQAIIDLRTLSTTKDGNNGHRNGGGDGVEVLQQTLELGEMSRVGGALEHISVVAARNGTTEATLLEEVLRKPHGAYVHLYSTMHVTGVERGEVLYSFILTSTQAVFSTV
jgi:hypothetical protein